MNYLDLFSGVGGFHLGLIEAGFKFDWTGHSEIDKYANEIYKKHFPTSEDLGDVRTIKLSGLPRIDIITFGFPCQDLSVAGKGAGLHGERSGLFFKAMQIIEATRPKIFIFENVKGLLTKNKPWFASILKEIADIGLYECEWQLLNTRWFLPQNRERLYFIGTLGRRSSRQIFPIREGCEVIDKNIRLKLKQIGTIGKDAEATRVYSPDGCARTIKNGGGMGAKTGLYEVKRIPLKYTNRNQKNIEGDYAYTVDGVNTGGVEVTVHNLQRRSATRPSLTRICGCGSEKLYKKCCGVDGESGHLSRDDGNTYCLDSQPQGVELKGGIRRLTPTECERLQGFPDGWTDGLSDTQRYKCIGNAVSIPVVLAIGERLYAAENKTEKKDNS